MKNISILGCGWLGKELAVSLLDEGYTVKGSTTSKDKIKTLEALEIDAYLVNIDDFEEFDVFLNSDILIIAITSKNIDSFKRLIQQIENSSIEKVVFISSTSVYPNTNSIVEENSKTKETDLKNIEGLFRKNTFFEATILRFGGLFDENRHPANWFKDGRKIPQPKGFVNMIHREDCINIIHEIIDQNCWNETFNACSNHHPTRRDFYTYAKLSKGLAVPEFEKNEILSYKIVNSKKIQETLNYNFVYDNLLRI